MLSWNMDVLLSATDWQEKIKQIFWSASLMIVPDKKQNKTQTKYQLSPWQNTSARPTTALLTTFCFRFVP